VLAELVVQEERGKVIFRVQKKVLQAPQDPLIRAQEPTLVKVEQKVPMVRKEALEGHMGNLEKGMERTLHRYDMLLVDAQEEQSLVQIIESEQKEPVILSRENL
jgi:hypothetical protein